MYCLLAYLSNETSSNIATKVLDISPSFHLIISVLSIGLMGFGKLIPLAAEPVLNLTAMTSVLVTVLY